MYININFVVNKDKYAVNLFGKRSDVMMVLAGRPLYVK